MWPMLSGANKTSPRTELFVTGDLLIQNDWKLITGQASSASWPGPTYPNASSAGNTLSEFTLDCAATEIGACLFNVGPGPQGDWTE